VVGWLVFGCLFGWLFGFVGCFCLTNVFVNSYFTSSMSPSVDISNKPTKHTQHI